MTEPVVLINAFEVMVRGRRIPLSRGALKYDRVSCGQLRGDVILGGEAAEDLFPVDPVLGEVDRLRQADQWTRDWMYGMGLHKLSGTVRYPRAA